MKKAFTLIELLVVIAIVAVVSSVLLVSFGGVDGSSRVADCLNKMRALAQGVQNAGGAIGHYPPAGSLETVEVVRSGGTAQKRYHEVKGWISWNSAGGYKGGSSSHRNNDNVSMYSTDEDERIYALTNGVLWTYINGDRSLYLCQEHTRTMKKQNPCWSYVMNAYFKWDATKGRSSYPVRDWGGFTYGRLPRADRILLFAEIQFVKDEKYMPGISSVPTDTGSETDAILQYPGCRGGGNEVIGFNHKKKKGKYCANIMFADGHGQTLDYPENASHQELANLTTWLCTGKDISFDGHEYKEMK